MKVFVAFALLIVATTAASLCNQEGANLADADSWKAAILTGAGQLFGHCTSFDAHRLLFKGSCNSLFNEGFCYSQLAVAHYGDLEVVSYGDLADDVSNIQSLGKSSCKHGRKCFNKLRDSFLACDAEDGFREEVIRQAEIMFRARGGPAIIERLSQHSNSLLSELATLLRSSFTSVDDIAQAIDQFVSPGMVSDARRAFAELDQAAQEWCDNKCTKKSGDFLEGLFNDMNGGGCVDASGYCGDCKDNADVHLASNSIPCCLDNAIQKGIAAVQYVRDNYAEEIERVRNFLQSELSAEAQAIAGGYRSRISDEIDCLSKSYNAVGGACV